MQGSSFPADSPKPVHMAVVSLDSRWMWQVNSVICFLYCFNCVHLFQFSWYVLFWFLPRGMLHKWLIFARDGVKARSVKAKAKAMTIKAKTNDFGSEAKTKATASRTPSLIFATVANDSLDVIFSTVSLSFYGCSLWSETYCRHKQHSFCDRQ